MPNAFQNFKKSKYTEVYFYVSITAGYWEEVLITDICYIKTRSKKRKRQICSLPKQNSLIISITHSSFFQQVVSLYCYSPYSIRITPGATLQPRDSLINADPYTQLYSAKLTEEEISQRVCSCSAVPAKTQKIGHIRGYSYSVAWRPWGRSLRIIHSF